MRLKITCALAAVIVACMPAFAAESDKPLATVNGEAVTSQDLLALFTDRHSGHARFLGGDREARQFLDIVINDRLLVQEAYDIGIDEDAAVKQLVEEFVLDKATKYLIDAEVDRKARVTPDEVRAVWEGIGFYVQGYQIAVDTRAEAEELRALMLRGEDVSALARACSKADSRLRGGMFVAGWGQFSPEWEKVVFAMEPGTVSGVIETADGFEVVMVVDRDTVEKPPYADVSAQIEMVLGQRKLAARRQAFSDELWQKYGAALQPLDFSPRALAARLAAEPDASVVTWTGGGKLTLKQIFDGVDFEAWSSLPPRRAARAIDEHIRKTVNSPLVALEAAARKIGEIDEIAVPAGKYREYTMETALFRDHIFHDLSVSDDEAAAYYAGHQSEFVDAERRHVAHVLLSTKEDAAKVEATLAGGADFSAVAKKSSRDPMTAGADGDLGWITAERVPPQFKEVLTMKEGAVSTPIQSAQGWHIVKVLEIQPARQLPFDEVRAKVKEKALDAKKREARAFWIEKLRGAAKIEISDDAIRKFVTDNQMGDVNAAPSVQHAVDAGPMRTPAKQ